MASRIGKTEWKGLYVVAGSLDAIQIGLDFLVPVGEIINEVANIVIGILFVLYFQMRGVSMIKRPSRLLSLLGVEAIEELTAGAAPAWILDIWYIHRSVAQETSSRDAGNTMIASTLMPLNQNGTRPPVIAQARQAPLNQGGVRLPNRNQ